ncbi:hypothetical protein NSP_27600 [Nodularia spumigena CCY9414]|jgi:predicted nucleic acid-binding protein|nr:hypothetical protein NSP_27600 [Nodularia spumigena CCY9414]
MGYLLDTCVISDFVKGEENTLQRIKLISPAEIFVSSLRGCLRSISFIHIPPYPP